MLNRLATRVLGMIGGVLVLLLGISALYPELTAQVLSHATPDISLFANWMATHVMGTGADGLAMATAAIVATTTPATSDASPADLNEMRQKSGELITAQRALLEKAKSEKRELSGEENAEYERMDTEVTQLLETIGKAEQRQQRQSTLEQRERHMADVRRNAVPSGARNQDGRENAATIPEDLRDLMTDEQVKLYERLASPETRKAFRRWILRGDVGLSGDEQRALSVGTASEGGNTVPVEEFRPEIIKAADNAAVLRTIANVLAPVITAQSLGAPTMSADVADADWTTELEIGSEDSTLAFGKRELRPWPLAKYIKVSKKLLRANPAMASFVMQRLGYKLGVAQSSAFNTGDGTAKPLGAYTANANGISTSRDVEIGNGSSAVDADKVITARYTLRQGYVGPNTFWHMHRLWFAKIRKLKASSGDYLWQPGLSRGDPVGMILLDIPCVLDEYAPSVTAHGAGVYAGIVGDWSYFWIVDALLLEIQRLEELYAATNQVGFIIRGETDGMPVLEDAFVRMIAAT